MRVEAINRCVFVGLTFSVSGMGTAFGENARDVLDAMDVVAGLPDDTQIFNAFKVIAANFEFGAQIEGESNPFVR